MPLSADRPVVLITGNSTTGDVKIRWTYAREIRLEHSQRKLGSTPVFSQRSISEDQLLNGSYLQTNLTPGDVYRVRAFNHDFDGTGMSDAEKARYVVDEVFVHALKSSKGLETDNEEKVGATFYRYNTHTGSTKTHAVMEIGNDRPVLTDTADKASFKIMPKPIFTVTSFTPNNNHVLSTDQKILYTISPRREEIEKLTESHVALIRVSDSEGNWEQIEKHFQTLRRKLTIDFKTIDANSIGEPASENEAEMQILLEAWDFEGISWSKIDQVLFVNNHVRLTPFAVRNFVANPVVVVGPRLVQKKYAAVSLFVKEYDPAPFKDLTATSTSGDEPKGVEDIFGEAAEKDAEAQPMFVNLRAKTGDDLLDPEQHLDVNAHVFVKVEHVV